MKYAVFGISFFILLAMVGFASDPAETLFTAKATIEAPSGVDGEREIRARLPNDDSSVRLRAVPNTRLFEIIVSSSDAQVAAARANDLTLALQDALIKDKKGLFKIWEKAEPPQESEQVDAGSSGQQRQQSLPSDFFGGIDLKAVYEPMFNAFYSTLGKPEILAKMAKFQRGYYEALIREGFSKDEALKIISSAPLPSFQSK